MRRSILLSSVVACLAVLGSTLSHAENTLGIGSKAPALDIEHYVSNGEGFFDEVTQFEDGKVYMVEFWATWCGPCIQSMPHLVELQSQYRGEGLQIVSISDESLEEVEALMEREYPESDKTFGELTSAYTLTVDPDGSVSEDYMQAAGRNGIPAAFLVGKTGLIEWIGHPMSADVPLEQIMADSWDREAYKKAMAREELVNTAMQKINQLAGTGKFEDAIKVLEMTVAEIEDEDDAETVGLVDRMTNLKYNLRLDSGDQSKEVLAFFRDQLAEIKGKPRETVQFAFGMMSSMQQGTDIGPLAEETIAALKREAESETSDEEMRPLMYVLTAQLQAAGEDFEGAIASQEKAVETSEGRQKERMVEMLSELKKLAESQSEKAVDEDAAE